MRNCAQTPSSVVTSVTTRNKAIRQHCSSDKRKIIRTYFNDIKLFRQYAAQFYLLYCPSFPRAHLYFQHFLNEICRKGMEQVIFYEKTKAATELFPNSYCKLSCKEELKSCELTFRIRVQIKMLDFVYFITRTVK